MDAGLAQPLPGRREERPPRTGLRWQLPVHSPITSRALGAGWRAAVTGSDPRSQLARHLAASYGAGRVTLRASGTDALTCAIRLACRGFGRSALVALPAYGCYDLATAVVGARCSVVLYDLDPTTLGPEPSSLREALRGGANVVVCAALHGMPLDWQMVEELTSAAGAVVIEDAAQGQGGSWRGRPLGALGAWSVLSFGRGKGWTGGRGGALLWRGGEGPGGGVRGDAGAGASELEGGESPVSAGDRVTRAGPDGAGSGDVVSGGFASSFVSNLATLLPATMQWALGRPWLYGLPASVPWLGLGETHYRDPVLGGEMSPAAAMLLLSTRGAALAASVARRDVAECLLARLPSPGRIYPIEVVDGGVSGYLRLPLRVPGVGAALAGSVWARRLGIASGYPMPLAQLPVLSSRLVGRRWPWPGAEELVRDLITLPTHTLLSRRDRERLVEFLGRGELTLFGPRELEFIPG